MLNLPDLDERTRTLMLEEMEIDIERGRFELSPRLDAAGVCSYAFYLQEAARLGSDFTLAEKLRQPGLLRRTEERRVRDGVALAKVPSNAADTLAEYDFNRFYIRALCRRALEDGVAHLEVFRAKRVDAPRASSQAKVGAPVDPRQLLYDLRTHIGAETRLGLPAGPNSGLSVRLPRPAESAQLALC